MDGFNGYIGGNKLIGGMVPSMDGRIDRQDQGLLKELMDCFM